MVFLCHEAALRGEDEDEGKVKIIGNEEVAWTTSSLTSSYIFVKLKENHITNESIGTYNTCQIF